MFDAVTWLLIIRWNCNTPGKLMCVKRSVWDQRLLQTSLETFENFMFTLENMGNCTLSGDFTALCCWEFQVSGWKALGRGGRRALVSVTEASVHILPSLHQCACFDWAAATRHAALPYTVGTCHRPSVAGQWGWKKGGKHRGDLQVVFLPSPFKSTLPRAPCWPLMLPVHLAKRSGETQDHRNGQKQFHPLSEPISTTHWEGKKKKSDTSKTPVKSFWVTSPNMLSSHPLVLSP